MANALYGKAKEGFGNADIDVIVATVSAYLVRGYTPDLAVHDFVDDVTGAGGGTLVAGPVELTGKSFTDGIFDAADSSFPTVAAGAACQHIVIAQTSAVTGGANVATSAQRLIALIDTATGLPVTPNGGNIDVAWDNGANKIFKL